MDIDKLDILNARYQQAVECMKEGKYVKATDVEHIFGKKCSQWIFTKGT